MVSCATYTQDKSKIKMPPSDLRSCKDHCRSATSCLLQIIIAQNLNVHELVCLPPPPLFSVLRLSSFSMASPDRAARVPFVFGTLCQLVAQLGAEGYNS